MKHIQDYLAANRRQAHGFSGETVVGTALLAFIVGVIVGGAIILHAINPNSAAPKPTVEMRTAKPVEPRVITRHAEPERFSF